jgi:hypothetical protein
VHWFPVPVPSEAATVLEQSQTIAVSPTEEEMMQVVQLLQVTPSILMPQSVMLGSGAKTPSL